MPPPRRENRLQQKRKRLRVGDRAATDEIEVQRVVTCLLDEGVRLHQTEDDKNARPRHRLHERRQGSGRGHSTSVERPMVDVLRLHKGGLVTLANFTRHRDTRGEGRLLQRTLKVTLGVISTENARNHR